MNENNTTASTIRSIEPLNENITPNQTELLSKDLEILSEISKINPNNYDLNTLIKNMQDFNLKLNNLFNIGIVFTNEFLDILKKLAYKDNIRIDLALKKIYLTIISHDSLYNNYLLFDENDIYRVYKSNFLLSLIEECTFLIEKLNGFIFDQELFQFKNKTLDLLKCIYFNCKENIKDQLILKKIQELLDILPPKFYSNSYIELIKNKELYEVLKSQNIEKIANFEGKFLDVNNYYEQYEVFKKFVENNSGNTNYTSVGSEKAALNVENGNNLNVTNIVDFYYNYGLLLLKFCKYHYYVFLDKEDIDEDKNGEENENARVVFLLDKFKPEGEIKNNIEESSNEIKDAKKANEKIDILKDKQFCSIVESKEYTILIKKEINYYLNKTNNFDNNPNIKSLREQMSYYLSTLDVESYVPLSLKEFNKVSISDNFTPAFSLNVPAGKDNKIYLETKMNENILVYIEFFIEDKSKDITFEVNKYDISNDSFKQIFKEENVNQVFKFFVLCNGYSLYEIIFNNDYSWFNSKDVNFKISLLKLLPKTRREGDLFFKLEDKNLMFNSNEVVQKMINKEEEKIINIPVILYLNNLRIATVVKTEDQKEDIEIKEIIENEEKYIPKHLFDFSIINHLKKLKIKTNESKKIIISIFSQNRELSKKIPEIEEKIENAKNPESIKYIQKIGFAPTDEIGEYNVEYKLYDLCEQNLIYHLFLLNQKKVPLTKTILFLKFDKLVVNYAIYNNGNIITKLNDKLQYNNNNIEEFILNFIKNVNTIYNGVNLVMNYIDYKDEEKKKNINGLIQRINKFVTEKLEPQVPVILYEQNAIDIKVFKYMNLFYN